MSAVIRLRREGTKNRPYYRIVVTDKRARRDGPFIELVGTYDPMEDDSAKKVTMDVAKIEDWISKGAQPSDTVRSFLRHARRTAPSA